MGNQSQLVLWLLLGAFLRSSNSCTVGYATGPGNIACYRIVRTVKSWIDAQAFCSADTPAGHLVFIRSAEDDTFIKSTLVASVNAANIWIGLRDLAGTALNGQGTFTWSYGNNAAAGTIPLTYTNW